MEIKIENYLSEQEIKEIVKEEFRKSIRNDTERILSNLAYDVGEKYVESFILEEDAEHVRNIVKNILKEKSSISFQLFKEPDIWGKEKEYKVYNIMKDEVIKNEDLIRAKVRESLGKIDTDDLAKRLIDNGDFYKLIEALFCVFSKKENK